jgi:hypothetical protein
LRRYAISSRTEENEYGEVRKELSHDRQAGYADEVAEKLSDIERKGISEEPSQR